VATLETTTAHLARLVGFPSLSLAPNREIASYVGDHLKGLGWRVVYDADEAGERLNVLASLGPEGDGGVALNGHLDVVPAEGVAWTGDPFTLRRDGDRLIGRGAVDMKGFLALCLAWAEDLSPLAAELTDPVHLIFTFDEEVGGFGAQQLGRLFDKGHPRPAIAIVGEPTEMEPITAHRGMLELTTTVTGVPGHASDPRGRVNAVAIAARMIAEIDRRAREIARAPVPDTPFSPPWTTLSTGRIEGGEARNVVPGTCAFLWEIRPLPDDDGHRILDGILDWARDTLEPEMTAIDPACHIATEIVGDCAGLQVKAPSPAADLLAHLGINAPGHAVSFGTDAGVLQNFGIDCVVFGPGSLTRAHQPDEYITTAELTQGLGFLDRLTAHVTTR
jgi:acetylornithine deacetylase